MKQPRNQVVQVRRFGDPDGLEVADASLVYSEEGCGPLSTSGQSCHATFL